MGYEEVTAGNVFQFEKEGDIIEGELLKKVSGSFNKTDYIVKTKSDEEFTVFGNTVLETKMARVEENEKIKITFLGEVKSKQGRMYKDYKVEVDK